MVSVVFPFAPMAFIRWKSVNRVLTVFLHCALIRRRENSAAFNSIRIFNRNQRRASRAESDADLRTVV
jgi:hypothetical protein